MSHDRGCPCGREPYDYDECSRPSCSRRSVRSAEVRFYPTSEPGVLRRSVNGIDDYGYFNASGDFVARVLSPDELRELVKTVGYLRDDVVLLRARFAQKLGSANFTPAEHLDKTACTWLTSLVATCEKLIERLNGQLEELPQ